MKENQLINGGFTQIWSGIETLMKIIRLLFNQVIIVNYAKCIICDLIL